MKLSGQSGVSLIDVPWASRDSERHKWVGRAVLCLGVLGAALAGFASYRALDPAPAAVLPEDLSTRLGERAHGDSAVAFSLSRMHSFLSLGVPSELVRERILNDRLTATIGRDGRALIADVLDYAHEIVVDKPRRRVRKRFFRRLEALNQKLADAGLGYYVYAGFEWGDEHKRVEQVNFDALDILDVAAYRVGERVVRILHVERRGEPRSHETALGFTAADYDEAFLVVPTVFYELHHGLLPARVHFGNTELFSVTDDEAKTPWYRQFRERVAEVMSADLGIDAASPERAHAALIRAVEIHELQHQIDYKEKLSVRDMFREVADHMQDLRLASASMHETSAHLAQMARDPVFARVTLAQIVSYGFTETCDEADCLAALLIVDELASEFGYAGTGELVLGDSYDVRELAERYTELVQHSPAELAGAAERAWVRLFKRPLATIERLPRGPR